MDFKKFLGDEAPDLEPKRIAFILAPLAKTLSWEGGTDKGPEAIIAASPALEVFDDELLFATCEKIGITTLPPLDFSNLDPTGSCELICRKVREVLADDMLPILLGGEHTVTLPGVAACLSKYPDLHVLQFDAHLDLRISYGGTELSHACVMRRLHDLGVPFTQVGIRSFSQEEWEFVREHQLRPFHSRYIRNDQKWAEKVCASITGPVYITFDVDALDPSVMPATGTPEPDGLSWHEATRILRLVAENHQVVGMDFTEFAPTAGAHHAAFTVAKLIYRMLGYIHSASDRSIADPFLKGGLY
ncbi:MAG: agmatinase [Proteobacteria bacterium]|nr:agmatinase [Pseudomonadota bacterium]MBU1686440.1 agmatinase [Pseudomonadota bacterium]